MAFELFINPKVLPEVKKQLYLERVRFSRQLQADRTRLHSPEEIRATLTPNKEGV